jgi:hypothetical protein
MGEKWALSIAGPPWGLASRKPKLATVLTDASLAIIALGMNCCTRFSIAIFLLRCPNSVVCIYSYREREKKRKKKKKKKKKEHEKKEGKKKKKKRMFLCFGVHKSRAMMNCAGAVTFLFIVIYFHDRPRCTGLVARKSTPARHRSKLLPGTLARGMLKTPQAMIDFVQLAPCSNRRCRDYTDTSVQCSDSVVQPQLVACTLHCTRTRCRVRSTHRGHLGCPCAVL